MIRKKKNELENLFATGNELIDLLLELDEIIEDLKTMLKKNKLKNTVDNKLIDWLLAMYNYARDKYSRPRIM